MRKSRCTESQIVGILKAGEAGIPVPELVRKHGISRQTCFVWRSKSGGATVKDLTRLRELETENEKLERMYAELALENAEIKGVLARVLTTFMLPRIYHRELARLAEYVADHRADWPRARRMPNSRRKPS